MFPDMFEIFNEESDKKEDSKGVSSQTFESIDSTKTFVVSIGGSVFVTDKPNTSFIAKFAESINKLYTEGYRFALVVGGGRVSRNYIAAAKVLGATNYSMDEIGIAVTRINAMLLIQAVENAYSKVLTEIDNAKEIIEQGKIPVFGGLMPGFTTDACSALIAESLKARVINLSDVDGVYSSDPNENPNAKFYSDISFDRLISLIKLNESKPGQNIIIDLTACLILKRSNIETFFVNGNDLENFEALVRGENFHGTIVKSKEQYDEIDNSNI